MSLALISDSQYLRTLGAVTSAEGGATDLQIEAALKLGQEEMLQHFTSEIYEAVLETAETIEDETDDAIVAKFEAFKNAETYFALARMPLILANAQFSETGIQRSIKTAQQEKKFASLEEGQGILEAWERLGKRALAPYLESIETDEDTEEDVSFNTKRGLYLTIV